MVDELENELLSGSEEGVKDESGDKVKDGSGDEVEDEGGLDFELEDIDVTSNTEFRPNVYKSPNLDRLKRRAYYCEDNVAHKTSMSVFVQASALSLFYHRALGIRKTRNINTSHNNS